MDTQLLIKKLHSIFCESNRADKKYSQVWLSDVDFGGLYNNEKYILNVKAEHEIDSCFPEIETILKMLQVNAKEELAFIWAVNVYGPDEEIHCHGLTDILIYTPEFAC